MKFQSQNNGLIRLASSPQSVNLGQTHDQELLAMGIIHPGPPPGLSNFLKAALNFTIFVETGTFHGDTANWACGIFDEVYSIELSPELHRRAALRLQQHGNLVLLQGDTGIHLANLIGRLKQPALFWLDAHWSLGETAGENDPCPLLRELDIILRSSLPHMLLIDDARLFCAPPALPHPASSWPSLPALTRYLEKLDRSEFFLFEDVLIVPPPSQAELVRNYLQLQDTLHSESPLRSPPSLSAEAQLILKAAETALAIGNSLEASQLAKQGLADFDGVAQFASLMGRSLLAAGDAQTALSQLRQACRLAPTEFTYHAELAQALALQGYQDEARAAAQWAFAADPNAAHAEGLAPLLANPSVR
jgi:tetratricopeptide (TPR) repeat protein